MSAAVTRLGGTPTQAGHAVDTDTQQAYCLVLADYSTLAITTERNIHICDAWTKAPTAMRRRSYELGHVFGAVHSVNSADLMYAIPRVDDYTEADIAQMCGSGVVRGGVCD